MTTQQSRPGPGAADNASLAANDILSDVSPKVSLRARLVIDLNGLTDESASKRLRDASMDARPGCEVVLRVPPGGWLPMAGIFDLQAHGRHASVVVEAPDTATGEAWLRALGGDPWRAGAL